MECHVRALAIERAPGLALWLSSVGRKKQSIATGDHLSSPSRCCHLFNSCAISAGKLHRSIQRGAFCSLPLSPTKYNTIANTDGEYRLSPLFYSQVFFAKRNAHTNMKYLSTNVAPTCEAFTSSRLLSNLLNVCNSTASHEQAPVGRPP